MLCLEEDRMTNRAKKYLEQVRLLEVMIRQREAEYAKILTEAAAPKSQDFTAERVQSSGAPDPMADAVIRCAELQDEIVSMITELRETRHRIISEIQSVGEARYVTILEMRYVQGMTLGMIQRVMRRPDGRPYSYQRIASLHGEALQVFEKTVLNEKK
jgi:hypothetical protein